MVKQITPADIDTAVAAAFRVVLAKWLGEAA
mgnify:CR=1 FL=1